MIRFIAVGAGLAVCAGAFVALSSGQADSANLFPYQNGEVVAAGAEIYADYCAACHGEDLEGEPDWRTRKDTGRMPAPPHDASGHTWHHPDQQLFLLTKYGVAALVGDGYQSDMGAYDGILSDDEIIAVLAYIKSTWPAQIQRRHDQMNAEMSN